jgi:hypothetical protein
VNAEMSQSRRIVVVKVRRLASLAVEVEISKVRRWMQPKMQNASRSDRSFVNMSAFERRKGKLVVITRKNGELRRALLRQRLAHRLAAGHRSSS